MKENQGISGEIKVTVLDKDGKVIKEFKKKMDSFVKNFHTMFIVGMAMNNGSEEVSFIDTDGTPRSSLLTNVDFIDSLADDDDDTFGIQVGSGTTPVSLTDYKLDSKIPHGTGSGQLDYGACVVKETGDDYRTVQRTFNNSSGGDVTVNEIGYVCRVTIETNTYYALLARDVISTTTVPNGGSLVVEYTFRINP